MANMSKKNFNLVRVVSEYYMIKKVLGNEYANGILEGNIEAAGLSGAADKKTLLQMKEYVEKFGQMKISTNGLTKSENFDVFMDRLIKKFVTIENTKPEKSRVEFSENPFDDRFTNLVTHVLNLENAQSRIETALEVNTKVAESVSALPVLLGGKKQSSYVKLLSQCTDLFASISGLQNQITTLKESGKAKDSQIKQLTDRLNEQISKVAEYKELVDKALQGREIVSETNEIKVLLAQTSQNLSTLTRDNAVQGRATRIHTTRESNRVIDAVENSMYEQTKIKKQMYEHPNMYPTYLACFAGAKLKVKDLNEAFNEIKRAAASVGVKTTAQSVDSIYVEMNQKNLENGNNNTVTPKKKGSRFVKVTSLLIALAIGAGGALGVAKMAGAFDNAPPVSANEEFTQAYTNYAEREMNQRDDYMEKLQIAIDGNTLVSFDNLDLENDGTMKLAALSSDGIVWNAETLQALRDQYAADDNVEEYGWSSTSEIDSETKAAISEVKADYYESNYVNLLAQVSSLNSQIDKLTGELNNANADKAALQSEIETLKGQVDSLQTIIDAAEAKYDADTTELQSKVDDLQAKLNAANEKVGTLQAENESLSNENENLKQENEDLKSQANNLDNLIAELRDEIMTLKYNNSVLSTDKAVLKSKVSNLEKQVADLQAQLDAMGGGSGNSSDVSELQAQINDLSAQLVEARATINELNSTNEALTQQVEALNNSVSELGADVAELENQVASLTNENTSLKENVESLKTSLANSMNDYNALLSQYQALLNSGNGSQAEIEALRAQLNSAYETISSYESKIVSLYNGLTKSQSTTTEAQQDLEDLLKLFGIDYNEQSNSSSNSSNEYQFGNY